MKQFHTGAQRGTDADDARYDLITPIGLRRLAETYAEGAKKYGAGNWEKGMSPIAFGISLHSLTLKRHDAVGEGDAMTTHTINRIRELHAKGYGRADISRLLHVTRSDIADALAGAPSMSIPTEPLQQQARLRALHRKEVFEAELDAGKWDEEIKDWWLRWGRVRELAAEPAEARATKGVCVIMPGEISRSYEGPCDRHQAVLDAVERIKNPGQC